MALENGKTLGGRSEEAKPIWQLTGTDGNALAVIGKAQQVLKAAGMHAQAREFVSRAFAAGSYQAALRLVFEYVEAR